MQTVLQGSQEAASQNPSEFMGRSVTLIQGEVPQEIAINSAQLNPTRTIYILANDVLNLYCKMEFFQIREREGANENGVFT